MTKKENQNLKSIEISKIFHFINDRSNQSKRIEKRETIFELAKVIDTFFSEIELPDYEKESKV